MCQCNRRQHAVRFSRQQSQHPPRIGCIFRLAKNRAAYAHRGVGGQQWPLGQLLRAPGAHACRGFCEREALDVSERRFAPAHGFIHSKLTETQHVKCDADLRQQLSAARAGRGEIDFGKCPWGRQGIGFDAERSSVAMIWMTFDHAPAAIHRFGQHHTHEGVRQG